MADQFDAVAEDIIVGLYELVRFRKTGSAPKFTSTEKISLRLSWNSFVAGDPSKRGFEMFERMFKNHPETTSIFSFVQGSSIAQMQNSSRLIFHVTRVVRYISKVIENLDNLDEVVPMLRRLGGRHGKNMYNVPARYFPNPYSQAKDTKVVRNEQSGFLGEALRNLMKENVTSYNEKTNRLWVRLYEGFIIEQLTFGQTQYGGGN